MKYELVVGLEIHAELNTKSKMFCSCLNDPLERHPNMNICPICLGHPGTLPVPNEKAIRSVLRVGLALRCTIAGKSKFDRKNYFYPDLPKGYQISQYDMPLCKNGRLEVDGKRVRITRIHLEEDTGKLVHPNKKDYSLVDFNRAGVPLMELVTEPDMRSAREARRFAEEFRLVLRYLNVSSGDMEKGHMRIEANISIRKEGEKALGTKVEIKNLNSFRAVERAIDFELKRQQELLNKEKKVVQETRGWNETKEVTFSQRIKEGAEEYRYFPEPDIPVLSFSKEEIEKLTAELPELPQARALRFKQEYGIPDETVQIFVANKDLGEYFEKTVSELATDLKSEQVAERIRLTANYITSDLQGLLKRALVIGEDFLITPENFAELMNLVADKVISTPTAKAVLKEMFKKGEDPSHIIEEQGLSQMTDDSEIDSVITNVIANNTKAVEDFKKGKETALQFLLGQVMAATKGKMNPEVAAEKLKQALTEN